MYRKITMLMIATLMGVLLLLGLVTSVAADGTETLGPPDSLPLEDRPPMTHTGVIITGTRLCDCASGELTVDVPTDAVVQRVFLYWYAAVQGQDPTTAISVTTKVNEGPGTWQEITGQQIGGSTPFWDAVNFASFRSDITELDLVTPGTSTIFVNFSYDTVEESAGLMVLYDRPDQLPLEINYHDGQDLAFFKYAGSLQRTVPQVFALDPRSEEHTVNLFLMVGSIMPDRPNQIVVEVGGDRRVLDDPLCGNCNPYWDTLVLPVDVPPDSPTLSVELVSTPSEDPLGASLAWIVAGVAQPLPPPPPVAITLTVTEEYTWTYRVENNGILDLEAITVQAGPGVIVGCPVASLVAGASMTCDARSQALTHYGDVAWLYAEPVGGGYPVIRWLEPELTP